ncbi:EF-hand superfamily Ca2+-modulated protein [Aaosphaeria arxii CBS 175.79]|uniref:Calmodulin n=1 Tax=Aaosphaeria arxii CBS 175.79 TaxID=1450172 RepID=A0A6A5XEN4_9PLEO|nr:EF-hand superfamily Ca2+-modulated protein [Aaosphaeria arxii CBS 175.79]KAF2011339.1 EF-hand superfamily Ca2+-modulated protein [Aaosphaeria arxii CBS 175.79]
MPPKRRAAASSKPAPKKRPSKLAKEHGLTAEQEAEIREAFGLFAVNHPDHEDSKEGAIRRDDVRRCLISLNLAPDKSELPDILSTIDPLNTGFVPFVPFLSYAAIAMQSKEEGSDEDMGDDDYDEESNMEEVRTAYTLFTHGSTGPITLAHLRRVAKELREDIPDDVLKDMIREANGAPQGKGNPGGVNLEDFESVMKRAGVSFG